MTESIFREPPPDADETWTHGAMLGGMCGYGEQDLAASYFLAGDTLIGAVLEHREGRGQDLIAPVMYLYRHGIELYLKCIVKPAERDHNLGALLEGFCRHVRRRYGEQVPSWITKPVSEFIRYDPASLIFRYEATHGRGILDGGEVWVDFPSLKKRMTRLHKAFRRVLTADVTGEIPRAGVG